MIRQLLAPYWHKFYDLLMASRRKNFYSTLIKPGDLCFDVGANTGNRTAIFLSLGAKVVSIEPQPACVEKLYQKFGNQITVIAKGLGAEEGVLPMHINDVSTLSSFSEEWITKMQEDRFSQYKWSETVLVPITTLDLLINQYGIPSFCKIDVEGFELQVLRGLTQAIPMISFEYAVPEAKSNLLEVIKRLDSLAPDVSFNYSTGESMLMKLPEFIRLAQFKELINTSAFELSRFGDVYVKSRA